MSNARTCNKCGGMTKFQLNDNGYPCFCESDTIQVSRAEYEALKETLADLAESFKTVVPDYGEYDSYEAARLLLAAINMPANGEEK